MFIVGLGLGEGQAHMWGQGGLCSPLPSPSHLIICRPFRQKGFPVLLTQGLHLGWGSLGLHCCGTFALRSLSRGMSLPLGGSGGFRKECSLG